MGVQQTIKITNTTKSPYGAEGFNLLPGDSRIVVIDDGDDPVPHAGGGAIVATKAEAAAFGRNPGVVARLKDGRLVADGKFPKADPPKADDGGKK